MIPKRNSPINALFLNEDIADWYSHEQSFVINLERKRLIYKTIYCNISTILVVIFKHTFYLKSKQIKGYKYVNIELIFNKYKVELCLTPVFRFFSTF